MIIDTHVHVGKFDRWVFDPCYISSLMSKCGVSAYIVSSTTTCIEDFEAVKEEILSLIKLDGKKVLPCLWITELALLGTETRILLDSGIKWKALKIHPCIRPWEWDPNGDTILTLFNLSRNLGRLPIIIHTGEDSICTSRRYESIISRNLDIPVVLAHGRPTKDAIYMASTYRNVYIDTAFMPIKDIVTLANNGIENSLLWGTDCCIPKAYNPTVDLVKYYSKKISNLRKATKQSTYDKITFKNAQWLYNLLNSFE